MQIGQYEAKIVSKIGPTITEGALETPGTTRILLVEDHSSFRQALALILEREENFAVVGQASTLAEARDMAEGVDVAVVDLALPDGSGTDLIRELHAEQPHLMSLVLSATLDQTQLARAIEAGAAGILHKSAAIDDIVGSVRRLKDGEAIISPNDVIAMLRLASREREKERQAQRSIERLTRREREVLQALAEGLDGKEIASKLHITAETERTHMVNILNKLGLHSRLQALIFAVRHGIVDIG